MNSRILILSDNPELKEKLRANLMMLGYEVSLTTGSEVKEDLSQVMEVDLIVIDPEHPQIDGSRLCQIIRSKEDLRDIPVIVMMQEKELIRFDFSLGISDFILKPLSIDELEGRIRQALRRENKRDKSEVIRVGELVIDPINYEVTIRGKIVDLTLKEYELLKFLALNKGRVFSREELLERVWGFDYFGGTRTVDVHIRRLRAKLESEESLIDTIRGVGYRVNG